MKLSRRLAEGIGSWLRFEFQCGHGHLFEEKYLSYPIGQILSSLFGHKVHAEYDHPVLAPRMIGRGRRPKLDFVVLEDHQIKLALELKWAGTTTLKVSDVIWDLIRLELVAHQSKAAAIFVLAGQRRNLQNFFESDAFLAPREGRSPRPILKTGEYSSLGMQLASPPEQRLKVIKDLLVDNQDIEMPTRIVSGKPYVYPPECALGEFQAFVWEITCQNPKRMSFLPKEHSSFKLEKSDIDDSPLAGEKS
jgi:hypothetical protein